MGFGRLILMFLLDFGPIILGALASILAYLLNYRLEDAKALKDSIFARILKRLVEFRNVQEEKHSLSKQTISIITWILAVVFSIFIKEIIEFVTSEWNYLITNYPTEMIKWGTLIFLLFLSLALFLVRKKYRRIYAFLEIGVGTAMCWDALNFITSPDVPIQGKIVSWEGLKLLAAVYVIIRGLANWDERPKPSIEGSNNAMETDK